MAPLMFVPEVVCVTERYDPRACVFGVGTGDARYDRGRTFLLKWTSF